ncbi:MAG TPA: hypothetical protein V6D17_22630 [Candidatus Obscuribacterales bacterium]
MLERELPKFNSRDSWLAPESHPLTDEISSAMQDPRIWQEINNRMASYNKAGDFGQFPSADSLLTGFQENRMTANQPFQIVIQEEDESFAEKLLDLPLKLIDAFEHASGIAAGKALAMEALKNPEAAMQLASTAIKIGAIIA